MNNYPVTARTRLRRFHEKGSFECGVVHAILDEALVCHVAFQHDGAPAMIATAHWRIGDRLYLHGSSASRAMRALSGGAPACIAVTLLDGLVLARSGFNHSVNYRSVVIYGAARALTGEQEKLAALKAFQDKITPGRWEEMRAPTVQELKATTVLEFDLTEVSAKVAEGPPEDEPGDIDAPVWAGVLPVRRVFGTPEPAPDMTREIPLPDYLRNYRLPR